MGAVRWFEMRGLQQPDGCGDDEADGWVEAVIRRHARLNNMVVTSPVRVAVDNGGTLQASATVVSTDEFVASVTVGLAAIERYANNPEEP